MQKWKVCKKLMAVILTLCMVLPLISNQYLVVRAEETGTGTTDTKKLSDLIAASDYVPVDLTKGEDVTLTDRTWTTDSYEYVDSSTESDTKYTRTDRGTLYQIKISVGQVLGVMMDLNRGLLWYKQDSVDMGYSQGHVSSYYAPEDETIYLWIPYNDLDEKTVPDTYNISFILGKPVSKYKEKATEITLNQKVTLDTSADNYLKNVTPNNGSVCNGWLYKTSLEAGYYTLNLDKKDGDSSFEFYPLDQDGNYGFTSDIYYSDVSLKEQFILEKGYIFIKNTNHAENLSISLDTVKALSELPIKELTKGETYTSTSADNRWKAGEYGYDYRIYKVTVAAGKMVNVVEKGKDGAVASSMAVLNERRFVVQESMMDGDAQSLLLNNDTDTEKAYYIGIYALNGTEMYTIDCTDIKSLAECAEKAVSVTEKNTIIFVKNDSRFIDAAKYNSHYNPGIFEAKKGAFVTFDVPAKTSLVIKLENDTSYKEYYVYESLANDKNSKTVTTTSYAVNNSSESAKRYYVWIPKEQAENATVSVKLIQNTSLSEVPVLQVGDNTVTTDAQVVEYTNYAGETDCWNGHVYQFTVPDAGTYAIGLKYTGTDMNTFKSMELQQYTLNESGYISEYTNTVSTNNHDKIDVLTSNLENGKTYYFKLQYTVDNQAVTEAKDMQGMAIWLLQSFEHPPSAIALCLTKNVETFMGFITNKERYNQVIDAWTHVNTDLGNILMKEMTSMIISSAQSGNIPRPATQAIRPATAIRSSQVAS